MRDKMQETTNTRHQTSDNRHITDKRRQTSDNSETHNGEQITDNRLIQPITASREQTTDNKHIFITQYLTNNKQQATTNERCDIKHISVSFEHDKLSKHKKYYSTTIKDYTKQQTTSSKHQQQHAITHT